MAIIEGTRGWFVPVRPVSAHNNIPLGTATQFCLFFAFLPLWLMFLFLVWLVRTCATGEHVPAGSVGFLCIDTAVLAEAVGLQDSQSLPCRTPLHMLGNDSL